MDVSLPPDVLGSRLRLDLPSSGPSQFPRRPRAGLRALRRRPGPDRVRQSARRGAAHPRRRRSARCHSGFAALAAHYLYEPCFCRPATGHDKGGVEARGKTVRWQHLVPIPTGPDLATINAALLARLDGRLERRRAETAETIARALAGRGARAASRWRRPSTPRRPRSSGHRAGRSCASPARPTRSPRSGRGSM